MASRRPDPSGSHDSHVSGGTARLFSLSVVSLMILSSLLAMSSGVTSDPVEVDNLDDTRTVVWDFDQASNYTLSGVELDGGQAMLQFMNQTYAENGPEEYCNGTMTNVVSSGVVPGSLVLGQTTTSTIEVELTTGDDGADAYVNEDRPNDEYGLDKDFRIDSEEGKSMRMLLWFDLSSIPSTAIVNSATLSIYESAGGKGDVVEWQVHPLETAFDEDAVSWNKYDVSGFWDTPGGDYSAECFAFGTFDTVSQFRYVDLSRLVEFWIHGELDNNGIVFVPQTGPSDAVKIFLASEDTGWPEYWPRLNVNYTIQGAVGLYESTRLGPATNATFTDVSWTNSTYSFVTDEFSGTGLDDKWSWMNDPVGLGGSYNVGISSPGELNVVGSTNSANVDGAIESNYLYQAVTGDFVAEVRLTEYFSSNSMGAGILLAESDGYWISVYKSDSGASGKITVTLGENGVSTAIANVAWSEMNYAFLRMTRNSTGVWMHVSDDGVAWTHVYHYDPPVSLMSKMKLGLFIYSASGTTPEADFDYFRVDPVTPPIFEVRVRVGNSTNPLDPSWGSWGSALPGQSASVYDTGKYLQYRVYLRTQYEWFTPMFSGLTFHSERYASSGYVETEEFVAEDFSFWHTLTTSQVSTGGVVRYFCTMDSLESWTYLGTGGIYNIRSDQAPLRVRVELVTYDTLVSPSVDYVRAMYGTALDSFFVVTPPEVVAGEHFQMTVYAKDAENTTMYHWTGAMSLQALDATTLLPAAGGLEVASSTIPEGGYVIISNQAYPATGEIVVRVTAQGMSGLSAPITVLPGPVVELVLGPTDTYEVEEYSSVEFTVTALDGCGNTVPDLDFEWSASPELGSLVADGDEATLHAGQAPADGYVNVSYEDFLVSRHITLVALTHAPVLPKQLPAQYRAEDSGTWTFGLRSYVYDPNDAYGSLRWYATNDTLVSVTGENHTGDLDITFTTRANCFGTNNISVTVVDPDGLTATSIMEVVLSPVNDKPVISPIDPLVVHYEVTYLYALRYYVDDVDNAEDDLSLTVNPEAEEYVTVDDRLNIGFMYPEEMINTTQSVVATVSDGELASSTVIEVTVTDDNVPLKTAESLPDVELDQGDVIYNAFDLDDYFMDPDDEMLYYASGFSNVDIDINDENEVSVFAPMTWAGEETVIFSAKDPRGARVESAMTVTVNPVNQPPSIEGVPDLTVRYDLRYEFDLTRFIYDADDAVDTLTVTTDDVHIAVMGTLLSMVYPESMSGTSADVNITVSDGEFCASQTIRVSVGEDTPPMALDLPDHSFKEDSPQMYPIVGMLQTLFYDEEDGSDLEFDAFAWDEAITVTAVKDALDNWTLRFATEADYYGESHITIRATDSGGAIVEATICLDIAAVPDKPTFWVQGVMNVTIGMGVAIDFSDCVSDPDSEAADLTFQVIGEFADYASSIASVILLEFPSDFLEPTEYYRYIGLSVRVYDQSGLYDTEVVTIRLVNPVAAQNEANTFLSLMLMAVGFLAVGLLLAVLTMRGKPFVIRDMMLVHDDGFLISRHEAEGEDEIDEDVFTGMLTAVLNFVEDSMSTDQEQLKSFGFEHYKVLIKRGGKTYAAIIFEGDRPKDIEEELGTFLEKTERIYRKSLANWTGDIESDFAGVQLLIKAFVDGHTRKAHKGGLLPGILKKNGAAEELPPPPPQGEDGKEVKAQSGSR